MNNEELARELNRGVSFQPQTNQQVSRTNNTIGRQIPRVQNRNDLVGSQARGGTSIFHENVANKSKSREPMVVQGRKKQQVAPKIIRNLIKSVQKHGFAFVTAALVASSITISANLINNYNIHEQQRYEVMGDGMDAVRDNTRRTDDMQNYYYLHRNIAENISESNQDFYAALYGAYDKISYDVLGNMNQIVRECHSLGITEYTDFEDLCIKNNFVKEDGTPDLNAYKGAMNKYVDNLIEIQENQKENQELMPNETTHFGM